MEFKLNIKGDNAGELVGLLKQLSQNTIPLSSPQLENPLKKTATVGRTRSIKGQKGFTSLYYIPEKNTLPDGTRNPAYSKLLRLCQKHKKSYPQLVKEGIIVEQTEPVKNQTPEETKSSNQAQPDSVKLPFKCHVLYRDPNSGRERTGKLSRQYPRQGTGIVIPDGTAGEALEISLSELKPIEAANGGA